MKISNILIGIVVMCMVSLGMAELWLDSANNYGKGAEVANMTMMRNTIGSMNSTLRQMSGQFKTDQANVNTYYPLLAPVTTALFLWNSMIMVPSFITDALSFGSYGGANFMPWWLTAGLITIAGLIVIFGIMAYMQRYSP